MESSRRSPYRGCTEELSQKLIQTLYSFLPGCTDPEVESFAQQVEDKFGPPELLVNNAGLINQNAPLTKVSPDEFAAVLSVNLGYTQYDPLLRSNDGKSRSWRIANFSSYWAIHCSGSGSLLCHQVGVEGLTRSLAQELPSGLAAVA